MEREKQGWEYQSELDFKFGVGVLVLWILMITTYKILGGP